MTPKFTQITTGQWQTQQGMTYTLFALGEDGKVYKFSQAQGWSAVGAQGGQPVSMPRSARAAGTTRRSYPSTGSGLGSVEEEADEADF